ncbi:LytR/AlgR family response regulator transcription factor [Sphingomonas alpina]|uniref:Response regulator transcription factor n=1 Tax=Sphingomonas alpina TaxID=653931 RepID=A0A7H0LM31_9SPHN|nr:LytTR family DNA-binding domain-containing protein [Sphingomonas alpina]QNQ10734.1 response regulator transcription factor [Sphingomonas alpina]
MTGFSVLIVDDEPLARGRIRRALGAMADIHIVGEAANVDEAEALIGRLRPDIVTLDIQLPGGTGFDLLERLGPAAPATIFVTAFDHQAQRAFDAHAIDYVTKPLEPARLQVAVARACARLRASSNEERVNELQEMVSSLRRALQQTDSAGPDFWVKSRGEYRRLSLLNVTHIVAERDYVRIFSDGESHLHQESVTSLEQRLPPKVFIRVHRSAIIRRDAIVRLRSVQFSALIAELVDGSEIRIGRTYAARIRAELARGRVPALH